MHQFIFVEKWDSSVGRSGGWLAVSLFRPILSFSIES